MKSRHSIGMQVCNVLAENFSCSWEYSRKYKAYVTSIHSNFQEFVLLKSRWPMNLNGRSVSKLGWYLLNCVYFRGKPGRMLKYAGE